MAASRWIAVCFAVVSIILGELYTLSLETQLKAKVIRVQMLLFFQLIMLIGGYLSWKSVGKAVGPATLRRGTCRRSIKVCLFCFVTLAHMNTIAYLFLIGRNPHWLGTLSYTCFGMYIQFGVALLTLNTVTWCLKKCNFIGTETDDSASEEFKGKSSQYVSLMTVRFRVILAGIYAVTIGLYGVYNASQPPAVRHIDIPVHGLPQSFDGFRIVELSDIHLGATVGRTMLQRIVDMTNDLKPDAVVLVGDLVDSTVSKLASAAEPVQDIRAPYGKFYVTGNHEYYTGDVDGWFAHLEQKGFTVLHNDNIKIRHKLKSADFFYLAGVDDMTADTFSYGDHGMKLDQAVRSCEPGRPIILLAHQPKAAKIALDSHYNFQLVLSGHTHGGQMFPFTIGAYLMNPFFVGLYHYNNRYVYVSEGTVYWGIPMRIGSSMEITHITLRKAS